MPQRPGLADELSCLHMQKTSPCWPLDLDHNGRSRRAMQLACKCFKPQINGGMPIDRKNPVADYYPGCFGGGMLPNGQDGKGVCIHFEELDPNRDEFIRIRPKRRNRLEVHGRALQIEYHLKTLQNISTQDAVKCPFAKAVRLRRHDDPKRALAQNDVAQLKRREAHNERPGWTSTGLDAFKHPIGLPRRGQDAPSGLR